jgi:hypothetical protein
LENIALKIFKTSGNFAVEDIEQAHGRPHHTLWVQIPARLEFKNFFSFFRFLALLDVILILQVF